MTDFELLGEAAAAAELEAWNAGLEAREDLRRMAAYYRNRQLACVPDEPAVLSPAPPVPMVAPDPEPLSSPKPSLADRLLAWLGLTLPWVAAYGLGVPAVTAAVIWLALL